MPKWRPSVIARCRGINAMRQGIYSFLSRVFAREIDQRFLQELKGKELLMSPELAQLNEELALGFMGVSSYLSNLTPEAMAGTVQSLSQAFSEIFGVTGPDPISLRESAYHRTTGASEIDPAAEVIEFYTRAGIAKSQIARLEEDHIAVELEFMARLAIRLEEALNIESRDIARHSLAHSLWFLKEHLSQWLPEFHKLIEQRCSSFFYVSAVKILSGLVQLDALLLDEIVRSLEGDASQ